MIKKGCNKVFQLCHNTHQCPTTVELSCPSPSHIRKVQQRGATRCADRHTADRNEGRGEENPMGKRVENPGESHENLWKSQEHLRKIHENPEGFLLFLHDFPWRKWSYRICRGLDLAWLQHSWKSMENLMEILWKSQIRKNFTGLLDEKWRTGFLAFHPKMSDVGRTTIQSPLQVRSPSPL